MCLDHDDGQLVQLLQVEEKGLAILLAVATMAWTRRQQLAQMANFPIFLGREADKLFSIPA